MFEALRTTLKERREAHPSTSYAASLLQAPIKKAAQKLAEEGVEVAIAATSESREALIAEMADLMFHLLVLCEKAGISFDEVASELQRREGVSGHSEKAARKEGI